MTITTQQALDALHRVCLRCGHEWTQQTAKEPTVCSKCHSPYWDKPRMASDEGAAMSPLEVAGSLLILAMLIRVALLIRGPKR